MPAIVGSLASLEASLLPPSALFSQFSHAFQPVSRVVSRQRGLMSERYRNQQKRTMRPPINGYPLTQYFQGRLITPPDGYHAYRPKR